MCNLFAIGETTDSADISHTTNCSADAEEIIDSEQDAPSFMIEEEQKYAHRLNEN